MDEQTTSAVTKPVRAGWKTTEFWVTILTVVGSTAAALGHIMPPQYAGVMAALSGMAYNISRGMAKSNV